MTTPDLHLIFNPVLDRVHSQHLLSLLDDIIRNYTRC